MIPEEIIRGEARRLAEHRLTGGWDQLHDLLLYSFQDGILHHELIAVIDLAVEPVRLPKLMTHLVMKFRGEHRDTELAAVAFISEGYGVTEPTAGAPAEIHEQFERDRKERNFHLRADRRESLMVFIVDGDTGNLASHQVIRGREGFPQSTWQEQYRIGETPVVGEVSGPLVDGVARAAAVAAVPRDRLDWILAMVKTGQGPN